MKRLLLAPLLFFLTGISFAKDKLNYTITSDSQIHNDKGNFGEYPEIIKAVKKNELMLIKCQRKLDSLKLDSNFPNISKTKQEVIHTSIYSDEEYEYISE